MAHFAEAQDSGLFALNYRFAACAKVALDFMLSEKALLRIFPSRKFQSFPRCINGIATSCDRLTFSPRPPYRC